MDNSNAHRVIETSTIKCWLRRDGIIHSEIKNNAIVNLEHAIQNINAHWEAGQKVKRPVLAEISGLNGADKNARQYAKENSHKTMSAIALLSKNKIGIIIGNFFISYDKPKLPTKMFYSKKDAIKWLDGFK